MTSVGALIFLLISDAVFNYTVHIMVVLFLVIRWHSIQCFYFAFLSPLSTWRERDRYLTCVVPGVYVRPFP